MIEVKFYDTVEDSLLKFAVIVSKHNGKWVFCKHKKRETYECPGGHRESGECIEATAKRELWEETGAVNYTLKQICVYSVINGENETFGMVFYADIHTFDTLPDSEIAEVLFFDDLPTKWTYPLIQPKILERVKQSL